MPMARCKSALLAGHVGQLQQGVVHEAAVGELALQPLAHGGGQLQRSISK